MLFIIGYILGCIVSYYILRRERIKADNQDSWSFVMFGLLLSMFSWASVAIICMFLLSDLVTKMSPKPPRWL